MEFCQKLDTLMSLTKVSNSSLARYCSLDASFISRLRRGKRNVVDDALYLNQMSAYLAKSIKTQAQKEAVVALIKKPLDFTDLRSIEEEILGWFIKRERTHSIEDALENSKNTSFKFSSDDKYTQKDIETVDSFVGFGDQGKREVVIVFLKAILASSKPTTLYLYSDENMDWLTNDKKYLNLWATLMFRIIKKGHKIKIIHTIERDFDEIINAIIQWIPMYLTGAIEPYYYPKRRDGVLNRTIFIASGIGVVSSNSINQTRSSNFYFEDKSVIESFEEEYFNLLRQCKPLMKIYNQREFDSFLEIFNEFESERDQAYLKPLNFSALTLPDEIINTLYKKGNITSNELSQVLDRKNKFKNLLETKTFYQAITLPEINKEIQYTFDIIQENSLLKYSFSKEELILQLRNIIDLMKTYNNFNLVINTREQNPFILYIKEGVGLIVIKAISPMIAFAVNESNLTAAFIDYFQRSFLKDLDRKKTIQKLEEYIKVLSKS